ncbi:hypothetical protein DFH08DRAFT_883795 [Mycena albidolilacea]|uniref:Uncharacterized protein n=1 Tax=Mycena albidolilacea TaxID=1033008 RepID=A0AAD7EIG1_9AGAR|nr:hypothetical protein DFH08DRAFT_883795 [Mycena albidolilacea]
MNPGRGRGGGPSTSLRTPLARSELFNGGGHTLGGEGSRSAYVPEAREEVEGVPVYPFTNWPSAYYSPSDATVAHTLRLSRQRVSGCPRGKYMLGALASPLRPCLSHLPASIFLLPPFPPPSPLLSLSTHLPRTSGFSSIGFYCIICRTNTNIASHIARLFICRRQRVAGREEARCQYKHECGRDCE